MHEFAICRNLLDQVEAIAETHSARAVPLIRLQIGPLAGVEPALLRRAFSLACAGTRAEGGELIIEAMPVRVFCAACNGTFAAAVNRLACPACAGTETKVVGGDEMVLASVELDVDDPQEAMPAAAEETIRHV